RRMGRIGTRLRRQVQHGLLPDLSGRHFLDAHLHAGERLELRYQRAEVVEVAGRNDGDGDRFAGGLAPVDLRLLVGREVMVLRARDRCEHRRGGGDRTERGRLRERLAPRGLECLLGGCRLLQGLSPLGRASSGTPGEGLAMSANGRETGRAIDCIPTLTSPAARNNPAARGWECPAARRTRIASEPAVIDCNTTL